MFVHFSNNMYSGEDENLGEWITVENRNIMFRMFLLNLDNIEELGGNEMNNFIKIPIKFAEEK